MDGCALCNALREKVNVVSEGRLVFSMINLRPLKGGHVMVLPKRHVEEYSELTREEAKEMFEHIEKIAEAIKKEYGYYPFIAINPAHRRSERHVHIHLIPSARGAREFFALAENLPMNEEAPPEIRIEMRERIANRLREIA